MNAPALCIACDQPASPLDVGPHGHIHMTCARARARAAVDNHCRCGSQRRPGEIQAPFGARGRQWIPCLRCLGTIKQVA
jgi:hypothetical protein